VNIIFSDSLIREHGFDYRFGLIGSDYDFAARHFCQNLDICAKKEGAKAILMKDKCRNFHVSAVIKGSSL